VPLVILVIRNKESEFPKYLEGAKVSRAFGNISDNGIRN
jgi:hypothetical protein